MSKRTNARDATGWRAWKLELWALLGSIFSFIAMMILLAVFDGRPIFDWKSVTLNAIVSVLSVSMKASLTFAVAELIGQWKWILFSQSSRLLMDFERIDLASRGPLGSSSILLKMKGIWPLQVGALVILLALALDPFSQQLVQLQEGIQFSVSQSQSDPQASFTTRTETYTGGDRIIMRQNITQDDPGNGEAWKASVYLPLSMQAAILNGLSRPQKLVEQQGATQCPTGDCSWDQFQTLGVCRRCSDLTSDLKMDDDAGALYSSIYSHEYEGPNGIAFVLPNGHFIVNVDRPRTDNEQSESSTLRDDPLAHLDARVTTFGTGDPKKANSMQDIDTLIWSMSFIHPDLDKMQAEPEPPSKGDYHVWSEMPIVASECAIYYCVKTIDTKIQKNIIEETSTEATDAIRHPDSWGIISLPPRSAPENKPPDNTSATLEYNELYSVAHRSDLVLHFPDNLSKGKYSVSDIAVFSMSQFVQELLSTNITFDGDATSSLAEIASAETAMYNGAIGASGPEPPALSNLLEPDGVGTMNQSTIPDIFETLATSITNWMRQNDTLSEYIVLGHTGASTKYYKVQWGWTALHGTVLIGSLIFWTVTLRNSGKPRKRPVVPAWKNSSLATISKGSREAAEALRGTDTVTEMERRARERSVEIPLDDGSAGPDGTSEGYDSDMYPMHPVNRDEESCSAEHSEREQDDSGSEDGSDGGRRNLYKYA